ncbi:hypothetical protein EBS80_00355 [bacterium]|nr:hypothetical protein [bacterium]
MVLQGMSPATPVGWTSWTFVLRKMVAQIAERERRAEHHLASAILLLHSIEASAGYVGAWRLLEKRELTTGETDGFRLYWRNFLNEWIDVVREADGTIHVTSTAADAGERYQFDEKIENPSDGTTAEYDRAIEYLLLN